MSQFQANLKVIVIAGTPQDGVDTINAVAKDKYEAGIVMRPISIQYLMSRTPTLGIECETICWYLEEGGDGG